MAVIRRRYLVLWSDYSDRENKGMASITHLTDKQRDVIQKKIDKGQRYDIELILLSDVENRDYKQVKEIFDYEY